MISNKGRYTRVDVSRFAAKALAFCYISFLLGFLVFQLAHCTECISLIDGSNFEVASSGRILF